MKKSIVRFEFVAVVALALFCGALNFGVPATAQETSREKVVGKPTPTPQQTPTRSPTITPTPTSTPTPVPIQTITELQSKIRLTLARPELRRGSVGVKIVSLDTNKVVFEENAEKYFMPASNMKSYTVAAAMEKLSPDFRFVTSIFAASMPDADGVIRGDLTILGRGDVSFSTTFYEGDYYKGLNALADKIVQAGVKKIEGNLVGDESYFSGSAIPESWEWDDLQWYYGAEISALPVNDNAVDLSVKSSAVNAPCAVQMLPANTIMKIVNRCVTSAAGVKRDLKITKKLDQNIIEITGTLPSDDKGFKGYVAVSRPAQIFVEMLRGLLVQKGVAITGQNKTINQKEKKEKAVLAAAISATPPVEIAKLESPPFSIVAAKTMKPSQNTYTETILWTLGEQIGRKQETALTTDENSIVKLQNASSAELGLKTVRGFLTEIGVAPDSVIQWDGSGLSRHNLVTPSSAVALYAFMSKSRYAVAWRDSLTIGAVDGTLQNRFKGTVAATNVRGKTGTIDQVSALSGYVTTATGERLVFSILVNGINDGRVRQSAIDEIVVALASFNGKL
ncbi:MAG: D-alanyl-D-alanine carboxypeptidase/D-alanyl-D-alanine-endopeptidase [Acidobacteriota bacterium]|nr:D-alanyl-D-alanine carboxypeptidase/D-alanyl-D-alanine-endopeptidase [Acidobacteriota bacterium]